MSDGLEERGGRPLSRRTFLKGTLGGAALLALGSWRVGLADGSGPRDLIVVSNNGARGGPSVTLVDPDSLEVLATVPLAGAFSFPATRWDDTRDLIWSGFADRGAVSAFRLSTGERAAHVETGSQQNYTEITPDGSAVIAAARFQSRFLKIAADPAKPGFGTVVARLDDAEGAQPCDITMASAGRYAYAPDRGNDTITAIDVERFAVASRAHVKRRSGPGPLEPYMATASPTGNVLFVENAVVAGASSTGSESIFDLSDPARPREVARLSVADGLGRRPLTSEVTPDGRYGMVICRDSSEVSVVDASRLEVVASVRFPAGSNPVAGTFRYGESGHTLFVPLPGRDALAAIAVPEFRVRKLIGVGPRPVGVVYLRAPLPARAEGKGATGARLGVALADGRTFPVGCPDPCCGEL
ncbi:MAG: twin-arginine translocation signal domain-containing protein [Deinococcales bacterium]